MTESDRESENENENEMTMNETNHQESAADDELQLISDGEGVAVIGEPSAVERFLTINALPSRVVDLQRLAPSMSTVAGAAKAASVVSAQSGRWVKLTEKSSQQLKTIGAMKGSTAGTVRGVVQGKDGQIKGIVEFSKHASVLTSPAVLAGIGGVMTQMAMQQQMDDIADYLAVIDEKVDDVLRAHKDAATADMIGIDLVIEEAMTIRDHVGRVSEVTWSKVQGTSMAVGRTQAYAVRQLDGLAEKLERKNDLGDLAKATKSAETNAAEWLAVLAHCFRLQEAIAVLELDRVLETAPEELEQHRAGLTLARANRREMISRSTAQLIERMNAAAARANKRVLLNPLDSPAVVRASNRVASRVTDFHTAVGIDGGDQEVDARRWLHAAGDLKNSVLEAGADGLDRGKRLTAGTRDRARSLTNRAASGIADRTAAREEKEDDD